ncbi:MAG: hypothetical protein ABI781_04740 [Burkholderiales bacterium]
MTVELFDDSDAAVSGLFADRAKRCAEVSGVSDEVPVACCGNDASA